MASSAKHFPRFIIPRLETAFEDTPVVCLLGSRQVGKTSLARQLSPARSYLSFDDHNLLSAAQQDPVGFVAGLPERVTLDEVQRVPQILPAIKATVDVDRRPGRFLLTGSANLLLLPTTRETLAGRMEVVELHPLSETEKRRGSKSLLERLVGGELAPEVVAGRSMVTGVDAAVCQGGYPEPITRTGSRVAQWYRQYLDALVQRDARDIERIRDGRELTRLVNLLARRTASLLNLTTLARELSLSRETADKYLGVVEALYLVRRLPAWHGNEAKRLIKTPKIHLCDSGLAASLNKLSVADWNHSPQAFGPLLESFVVQQFLCHASWLDEDFRFYHYRDKDKREVDLVIEHGRALWGVEVKCSATLGDGDSKGLTALARQAGSGFRGGILLYSGASCLPLKETNCLAVPLDWLWR